MATGNPRISSEGNPLWGRVRESVRPPTRPATSISPNNKQIVRKQHPLWSTSSSIHGNDKCSEQAPRQPRASHFSEEFRAGKPNDPSVDLVMFRERSLIVDTNHSRSHKTCDEYSGYQRPLSYSFAPKDNAITPSLHFQNGTVRHIGAE